MLVATKVKISCSEKKKQTETHPTLNSSIKRVTQEVSCCIFVLFYLLCCLFVCFFPVLIALAIKHYTILFFSLGKHFLRVVTTGLSETE